MFAVVVGVDIVDVAESILDKLKEFLVVVNNGNGVLLGDETGFLWSYYFCRKL